MRKDDAFDGQPGWNWNLQSVARTLCTTSVSRDCAHHRKTQRTLERVDRNNQYRPATSLLVSRRPVGVNLDEVACGEHCSENLLASGSSEVDEVLLCLAQ